MTHQATVTDILSQDIQFLPGVGPARKKLLAEEAGIETYGDLLTYYPYKPCCVAVLAGRSSPDHRDLGR